MSHKKHGQLTTSGEWARHLRPLLRRWFWKGERQAAVHVMRAESSVVETEGSAASVEALLGEVGRWSEAATEADLWVPDQLTLQGQVVAQDVAMAVVLNKILGRGLFPNGFTAGTGGRVYHYKRE